MPRLSLVIPGLSLLLVGSFFAYPTEHNPQFEDENGYQQVPVATSSPNAIRVPVLIYHSVRPDYLGETRNQKDFSITPELFEQQLMYLKKNGFTVISLDQLTNDVVTGTTSPVRKPVVLTFDDGLENQYKYAFPLLQKYHMIGTFYIYTHPLDTHNPHYLTWEQVKNLNTAGMTIGDHTITHPFLSKLSPEALRSEVLTAKIEIEKEIGEPVRHFASPFGYTSPELVQILKDVGFVTGRTTYRGAHHDKGDELQLKGFLVSRSMRDFEWMLNSAP